ncbi:MAG TPA: glycoside hydrolase family 16 protein [Gemmataceae bacterium]|jgi:beta-glucanase (GH16 family)|nr:glycoside hydrolase family 16 protein [Gemmataceae bacterium]
MAPTAKHTHAGLLAVAVAVMSVALARCPAAGTAATERLVAEPETVFFDDFSGPALDRTKWRVEITGQTVNDEQQAYVDSPDTISIARGEEAEGASNGALVLQARYRTGFMTPQKRKFDFVSGRINTRGKFDFAFGTAAARIKLSAGSGLWPAFWALGNGRWPACGEIDIMEYVGETDWTSVALHGPGYSGETPLVNKFYFPRNKDATTWHVYAVDWTPKGFVFKVDDEVVYRATRPMIEHYGRWAYDNPAFLICNMALGGAYPVKTNGVKSPYPGLPAETVELIKAGKAKMLVDWVRVTKN